MFKKFKANSTATIQRLIGLAIFCFAVGVFLPVAQLDAQAAVTDEQAAATEEMAEPTPDEQAKLVRGIYDATKTARTVKDYTAFLAQCEGALAGGLTTENRAYIASLTGWALNRRGQKRFELATQLKKVGNKQYDSVIKQVMDDYGNAIIADPKRHRSWLSRGIAHVANGDLDKAILDFTEVVKLKTDEPNGWFNRAEALYERGNYEHAIQDYDVALRLNSNDAQALTGRGHARLALGQFDEALTDFQRVLELHPRNDAAYVNRGDAHQGLGNWALAQADYDNAIAIKETGIALQRSAWLQATCPDETFRNSVAAQRLISKAIKLDGNTTLNLDTLAAVEAAAGNFESAKTTQQKVIGLVGAELELEKSQYEARLMLYEESKPFVQQIDDESDQ